jgi:translation elongation factor EF-G
LKNILNRKLISIVHILFIIFFIEQQRKTTLKGSLATLLFFRKKGKSCVTSFFDCPGHPEFFDQTINSLSLSDGSIVIVDIAEGVLLRTKLGLRTSILASFPVILVVNALDRMVIEYNSSPREIFIKIVQIIDDLNFILG